MGATWPHSMPFVAPQHASCAQVQGCAAEIVQALSGNPPDGGARSYRESARLAKVKLNPEHGVIPFETPLVHPPTDELYQPQSIENAVDRFDRVTAHHVEARHHVPEAQQLLEVGAGAGAQRLPAVARRR